MDFSTTTNISIFYFNMQQKAQFFLSLKVGVDYNNHKYNQLLRVFAMDFDLCIEWDLFIETSNLKTLFFNLAFQKYAILVGQLIVMIPIYVNHIVELLCIFLLK